MTPRRSSTSSTCYQPPRPQAEPASTWIVNIALGLALAAGIIAAMAGLPAACAIVWGLWETIQDTAEP